jgi:[glutamine synthetase] adenylyltransferase / [glutamine synthetase]-adenylyl-L-tyrosine phosphorylase
MKPDIGTFKSAWPEIDERLVQEHLSRLGDGYFEAFKDQDIYLHLLSLGRLSPAHPVEVVISQEQGARVTCTVLAYDYPSEFSLITGILAASGMNILAGDVFTYEKALDTPPKRVPGKKGSFRGKSGADPLRRRRIIDSFSGTLDTAFSAGAWAEDVRHRMEMVIGLLEQGDGGSVEEAKQRVNEMVVRRLAHLQSFSPPILYPVRLEIDNRSPAWTRLTVVSEDTPAFLYALSTALSFQGLLIEHVRIRTVEGLIEDLVDLVDGAGSKVEDQDLLDRLRISALLTKQFTYFLGKAPDPYSALSRFEHLLEDIFRSPAKGRWLGLLTDPDTLQGLARLLGTSDFLWEDFIRVQYETLLPMLRPASGEVRFCEPLETLPRRLREALKGARSLDEGAERLNEFKDREIYRIDLDHILHPDSDFQVLSERLTVLAENVVRAAAEMVYLHLQGQFGTPRTIAGLEARYAVLGLGKLGGAALGYASDIEILLVYSDNGRTDGDSPLENPEFFDRLMKGIIQCIRAKREGIFHVDVRLRPFGSAGPLACSLETFCNYYAQGGQALSYERLALVRMRAIGGDEALGMRLERLRDEMLYFSQGLDLRRLKDLRERQMLENTRGGRLNAKFSPGGLVDVEYGVQILQVMHGCTYPELRTPRIHQALHALKDAEILSPGEVLRLLDAYDFLRRLINGMRMLRGSARDLFLPAPDSAEFTHLARRMGYERGGPLSPSDRLRVDFEMHSAAVRVFAEQTFGGDTLPGRGMGTVVDLVLSETMPRALREPILRSAGFKDPERAWVNLRELSGTGYRKDIFVRLALMAFDVLGRKPDPDMALNNWERFIRSLGSAEFHYNLLLAQPMRLEILLGIFSGSQFLADTLIRNPGFLDWVMDPVLLHHLRNGQNMEEELDHVARVCKSHPEWLNRLRRFRRREILRIGTRDLCLGVPTQEVMADLSTLADVTVRIALDAVWGKLRTAGKIPDSAEDPEDRFCVLAFGKLGGNELNYSSDIDLLAIWDDRDPQAAQTLFRRAMEGLSSDLSAHTEEGYAYRVDLRLRPFGRAGELVPSLSGLIRYYRDQASLWEIQAALKLRPLAGNPALGHRLLEALRPVFLRPRERGPVVESIEEMRNRAIRAVSKRAGAAVDVKSGLGGLRDVEFMVQGLQLIHGPGNPSLFEGNTLTSLDLLQEARILPSSAVEELKQDYLFLRRVEHCLQILEDRQVHSLPSQPQEMEALGKRVLGVDATAERFLEELTGCLARVRGAYNESLGIAP